MATAIKRVDPAENEFLAGLEAKSKQANPFLRTMANRPEVLNAFDPATCAELGAAIDRFENDPNLYVGVITGDGERTFSAGFDLHYAAKHPEAYEDMEFGSELVRRLDRKKPLIAAVNGAALGFGFELALACDFRVVTTRVRLGCVETRVGMVITGGASVLLPTLVGQGQAREMILTANIFDAAAANQMGLIHRLVDPASLDIEVQTLTDTLLRRAPLAVRESKRLLNRPLESELERAFQNELEAIMRCFGSADAHEAAVAFREKRPPLFQGK